MKIKFQYFTNSEREEIINNNSSLYLIEEQNIIDGNFLIFSDSPLDLETRKNIVLPEEEYNDIINRVSDLEMAIAAILGGAE